MIQSKQMGKRVIKSINCEGRMVFDLFLVSITVEKLNYSNFANFSLNNISKYFLEDDTKILQGIKTMKLQELLLSIPTTLS